MVYELATGNTAVRGLAWDKTRNCLYAATECEYVDCDGRPFGYRWANVPSDLDSTEEQKQEDNNTSEADVRLQPPQCWPKRAYHAEDYFGHAFDAGEHRILRYQFKSNANPRILRRLESMRLQISVAVTSIFHYCGSGNITWSHNATDIIDPKPDANT
ncbi:uncharacterized protein ARMOST_16942 [Armillaria ostoyae]|uniref:Uncharacterized protein n=1 Tax=Armillaria ostoyae TaxID=47428 RepID=A0A284RXL6_ARMOS|nr:uncharacterized protein ARMOST_16942 [Armillaria ostoyae]